MGAFMQPSGGRARGKLVHRVQAEALLRLTVDEQEGEISSLDFLFHQLELEKMLLVAEETEKQKKPPRVYVVPGMNPPDICVYFQLPLLTGELHHIFGNKPDASEQPATVANPGKVRLLAIVQADAPLTGLLPFVDRYLEKKIFRLALFHLEDDRHALWSIKLKYLNVDRPPLL